MPLEAVRRSGQVVNSESLFVGASQPGNILTRLFPANERGKLLLRANKGT